MKKLLLIPLTILILTACGNNTTLTEDSSTTSIEEVQTTTEPATTEKTEPINPKLGIYVTDEADSTTFIELNKREVILWDTSKYNNGYELEHYINNSGIEYNTEYMYEIKNNTILLKVRDFDKTYISGMAEIITEEIIEYKGVTYYYDREFLLDKDNYELNLTGYPQYDELITKMAGLWLDENSDSITVEEIGVSQCWASAIYGKGYGNYGFYLTDLNNDEIPELFFGSNHSSSIYDIYTIKEDKLTKVATGLGKSPLYICKNNIIKQIDSNGASKGTYYYYNCIDGQLVLHKALMYDVSETERKWYLCEQPTVGMGYVTTDMCKIISSEEAYTIQRNYPSIPIEFTLFFKFS